MRAVSWAFGGAGVVVGVDGFVDAGDDDGGVSGELAGGVDGVLVPGAVGEAGGVEQGCASAERRASVEGGRRRRAVWAWRAVPDGGAGGGEALGGGEGGGEVERVGGGGGGVAAAFRSRGSGRSLRRRRGVVVGEDVGVGHVEDFEAEDAGLLLLVDEGGVGVADEPVVVVEGGVVDAVGAVGADVGGGDAEVLEEGGVVGAGAEVADADGGGGDGGVGWGGEGVFCERWPSRRRPGI